MLDNPCGAAGSGQHASATFRSGPFGNLTEELEIMGKGNHSQKNDKKNKKVKKDKKLESKSASRN